MHTEGGKIWPKINKKTKQKKGFSKIFSSNLFHIDAIIKYFLPNVLTPVFKYKKLLFYE